MILSRSTKCHVENTFAFDIDNLTYVCNHEFFKSDKASLVVAEITASEALGR